MIVCRGSDREKINLSELFCAVKRAVISTLMEQLQTDIDGAEGVQPVQAQGQY